MLPPLLLTSHNADGRSAQGGNASTAGGGGANQSTSEGKNDVDKHARHYKVMIPKVP